MTNFITLTSGFIIAEDPRYVLIEKTDNKILTFLSVNHIDKKEQYLNKLIKNNAYSSIEVSAIHEDYINNPSSENYIKIIDTVFELTEDIPLKLWLKIQLIESNISPLVKHYLLDFITNLYIENSDTYKLLPIPFNVRFNSERLTSDDDKYLKLLDDLLKNSEINSWKNFIIKLDTENKLLEFFRLVFIDYY